MLRSFFISAGLGTLALITIWATGFAAFLLIGLHAKPQGDNMTTDAIVVPTGGNNRIETSLDLFAAGRSAHLFITGANPQVKKRHIVGFWSGETTLPPCCITLGYKATTTSENAQETREWIEKEGYRSILLLTSDFHMARSLVEFHHALPEIEIIPYPIMQPNMPLYSRFFWETWVSEYHKTLYRFVVLSLKPKKPLNFQNIS